MRRLFGVAVAGQGICHSIDHGGRGTNGAEFAHALHAQHIVLARGVFVHAGDEHAGHDVGMRHGVVHQAAGDRLAGFAVVHHMLAQRLANALHRAAIKLAPHNHGVDHAAHIVDR